MKSYMINWYRIPNKGAIDLTLIMSNIIKLTAGKFMDLSLASFCSVSSIKIIFTYTWKLFLIIYKKYKEDKIPDC